MSVKGVDMTEAFVKWCEENGINNPADTWMRLRAFVGEVEREIGKARFRTSINVASAYEKFVREFGLDGEGK